MEPAMIFAIIMACIALVGGSAGAGVAASAKSKQKEGTNRVANLETEVALLKQSMGVDDKRFTKVDDKLNSMENDMSDMKTILIRIETIMKHSEGGNK